ncbi:uncharacterized protein C8A04DRAFT_28785 [Dichotomopilus funicola]|uniref:ATP-grasp domain-containing protein n=1 Tax=Dichotomopilus funicola TaxID=1934379 RepID=A0AAN6V2M6_9PEZI|nr:hypothetical protein C8A04DRAFT_28785 [Dichotomopilus funicola]
MALPVVKLDATLSDLYREACPQNARTRLGMAFCGISSAVGLTRDVPRNTKFIYQDQTFVKGSHQELSNDNISLTRSLAKKCLSHISQRDSFLAGNAPVIFFNLGRSSEDIEHDRRDAEATFSALDPSQRPELIFCAGPASIPLKEHAIDRLQYKVILDGLEQHPLTHSLEAHFILNSKGALARSGIPTPKCQFVETEAPPPPAQDCCLPCQELDNDKSLTAAIPLACEGPRGCWLSAQIGRILDAVRARPIPFVVKTQQGYGGAGTWLIRTEVQKAQLLLELGGDPRGDGARTEEGRNVGQAIGGGLLHRLLPLLTSENAHLSPTAILLTELIEDPVNDYGLTFLVTSTGEARFLAASEQILTTPTRASTNRLNSRTSSSSSLSSNNTNGTSTDTASDSESTTSEATTDTTITTISGSVWTGSTISYSRQDALRKRLTPLMERIAAWVASHGYAGPVGADVLEASNRGDGGEEFFVVDLNVRTTGSMSLPLMRGHFTSRGLMCASTFSLASAIGRKEFIQKWRELFEAGRMVILSWFEDSEDGEGGVVSSIGDVALGAEDEKALEETMMKVKAGTEDVTL